MIYTKGISYTFQYIINVIYAFTNLSKLVWLNMSDLALVSHIPTMWCVLNVPNNDLHGADTLVPTPEHPQYAL